MFSSKIIATSHDLAPMSVAFWKENPRLFQGNLVLWLFSFDHTLPCSGVTAMAFKHHLLFMLLLAPRVLGIRVIVAGLGRTGTLSMLSALKILGHWVSLMCIDDARF